MEQMQAYIGIRGAANSSQFADVPHEQMDLYQQHWWKAVHTDVRIAKTKWVVLRYPTDSFAQAANMSTPAFEDFYFDVCTADYAAMEEAQEPLVDRMRGGRPRADRRARHGAGVLDQRHPGDPLLRRAQHSGRRSLHRAGPRQHQRHDPLQHAVALSGHRVRQHRVRIQERQDRQARRPTKPRRSTRFSTPTKAPATAANGRSASTTACAHPMLDTLFDEKIGGSFHLTPGNAYEIADNGNRSRIHWDLVLIQRPDYGGGEIWFDGELLRKDGRFVPADLQGLNVGL